MGKFDLGLWVSAILLVIAVVLTILLVRGKFGIPWCFVAPHSRSGATACGSVAAAMWSALRGTWDSGV